MRPGREASGGPITIVLADDHRVVRAGLKMLLDAEDDFQVVAEAGDVALTERRVAAYHPSVLVLDVNMPGGSSLPSIPRILDGAPDTRIVVLTMQNDAELAREALRAGATGYVLKEAAERRADPGGPAGRGGPDLPQPRARRPAWPPRCPGARARRTGSAPARWRCCA